VKAGFCEECGVALEYRPDAKGASGALVCPQCGRSCYRNPAVHAGCILAGGAGGRACVASLPVGTRESLQQAAWRAAGASGRDESQLRLVCALTDVSTESVHFLFEPRGGETAASERVAAGEPAWAGDLLACLALERPARPPCVYTAVFDGARLQMQAMPRTGELP